MIKVTTNPESWNAAPRMSGKTYHFNAYTRKAKKAENKTPNLRCDREK